MCEFACLYFLFECQPSNPFMQNARLGFRLNGGDIAGKSQKNAEVILKMIPKKQRTCCEYHAKL